MRSISWLSPAPRTTIEFSAIEPGAKRWVYRVSSTAAIIGHAISGKPGKKWWLPMLKPGIRL